MYIRVTYFLFIFLSYFLSLLAVLIPSLSNVFYIILESHLFTHRRAGA